MKTAQRGISYQAVALGTSAFRAASAQGRRRLSAVVLFGAVACGGSAFSTYDTPSGSGGSGGSGGSATAGSHSVAGAAEPGNGGDAGVVGGMAASAGADAGGAVAAGGAPATDELPLTCSELGGSTYAGRCYVDATVESVNQLDAVAACAELALRAGRSADLLVLDSVEEQSFIVTTFLSEVTDAWLALTCDSLAHPQLSDCYCHECEDGQLLEKRAAWAWADGSSASFGWSGNNPDGAVRCSALAYNPNIATWGWVDRSCLSTSNQLGDLPEHSYRVICELP